MGTCKYCGQSTVLFSRSHKECENKHDNALSEFGKVCSAFFAGHKSQTDIVNYRNRLKTNSFLSDEDIVIIADKAIRAYTDSIRRPFVPSQLALVDSFINAIGVSYANLNRNGAVDTFSQKLLKGFMVDYFTDQLTLPAAQKRCQRVTSTLPMNVTNERNAYLYVLDKAAKNFLADGMLTDQEQQKIDNYISALALPVSNLPAEFNGSDLEKLGQASILKNYEKGIFPPRDISIPVVLGKQESVLWAFNGVTLYEEKIEREWVGRNHGMSFRICRGVYYRTGGSKGHPVEHSTMQPLGTGTLFVTNKNLIFHSMMKGLKIQYKKIIGATPYSDGIEIHRDVANAKRLTFQGLDSWFIMNLLSIIAE